ncbi:NTP transferase domain-containing protein [Nitrospirillum sp. BR 11828]|uniref:phosphocholine cytidylyltransferase family protein n=1 Tax=Nitrospirillum sp. BR 11828 TaxID=3104325 RepID=UPI002ACAAAE6|nr:NTP transferase domain-containing protein [Nitrospirillum sp. BR 11828]MDZ5645673.1 NTP transferase domain-containing protein [Nitrospirillum sp. BR 11828]
MKCLIVAAGQGTRLRDKGLSKPLIPIKGSPLIERVIQGAHSAGVDEFVVVSGYRGQELRAALDAFAPTLGVTITHVVNDEWDRANGISVYKARAQLTEPFLLTMCDHLVDPGIFRALMAAPVGTDTVTLAVDFNIDRPLNDPEDVTRVKCVDGRIENIGKVIRDFNAFDTGVFLCTPGMFMALEASQAKGDDSISGAMNVLAGWKKALVLDIGERIWIDVDDPAAFAKAETLLDAGQL